MLLHVVLHLTLCGAVSRLPAEAPIEIRVRVADKTDRAAVDRVFEVPRGSADQESLAFDIPWGVYRLETSVPAYDCTALDYFVVQPDRNRSISETLSAGEPAPETPLLIYGIGPPSFHAARPQFVVFHDDSVACNAPLPDPLPVRVRFEHQGDAYYATVYGLPPPGRSLLLAIQLETPEDRYQYEQMVLLSGERTAWPTSIHFNFGQKKMDGLQGKTPDLLFCPAQYLTTAG